VRESADENAVTQLLKSGERMLMQL